MTARQPASRRKVIRHGTTPGYNKHRRVRKASWAWPPCILCSLAANADRQVYSKRPEVIASTRRRNNARQRALRRLKDMHPGEFARLFSEEVSLASDGGTVVVANLRHELCVLAGQAEVRLARAVQDRTASKEEAVRYFQILDIRRRIREAEERVARFREPSVAS
jgi:hypothetical protein